MIAGISPAWLDERVALSLLAGAQVMVVWFSVVIANAYREQALWLHAGAAVLAVVSVALLGGGSRFAPTTLLLVLALAGLQLRDLVSLVGAIRTPRLWLARVSAWLLPVLAVADAAAGVNLLLLGVLAWTGVVTVLLSRAPGRSASRGRPGWWPAMWRWSPAAHGWAGARSMGLPTRSGRWQPRSLPGPP